MPFETPSTGTWSSEDKAKAASTFTSSSVEVHWGIRKIHLEPTGTGAHFGAEADASTSGNNITVNAFPMADATLTKCSVDVLTWPPAYEEYQSGYFYTGGDSTFKPGQAKASYRVNFGRSYRAPPQVVTCFWQFDISKSQPWRLTCKATDIDKDGFTAHINAWGDTYLERAYVRWFAHPTDRKGVVSGDVSLMDLFRSKNKIYWPSGAFETKPRICFVGLRYFNSDNNANGLNFGIDYTIEDGYVKFSITDDGRLEGTSFSYVLME